jgi:hypothetical protein
MAIDFTIESPAPPKAVLDSIRHHAGEWRESRIPSTLRADRVLTIEGYAEGTRYRYGYMRRWYGRGERELHVWGEVRPGPDGGSVVTLRCGYFQRITAVVAVLAAAFIACVGWRQWQAWLVVALILSAVYASWLTDETLTRGRNPQADYLVSRIEAAVASASVPAEGPADILKRSV